MKTLRIATILVATLFFVIGQTTDVLAINDGERVLSEKSFEVNSTANLEVDHEFGKVICINWDKDVIAVKVTAKWKSSDESRIQKMIDKVELDVHGDRSEVVVHCKPGHKHSNGNNSLSLIVEIQMPKSISLELSQKFGFALIETVDGPADISSEYGSLQINELNNAQNDISIEFGNGSIKHLTAGDVDISYSEFKLETAGKVSLNSEFSNITVSQKAKTLSIELEGGNLTVKKVGELTLEAEYSNTEIDELYNSLSLESEYGGVEINYVSPNFTSISIENDFGSVDLTIDEKASYIFEAKSEYGDINYPEKSATFSYKKSTSNGFTGQGKIGKGEPKSTVSIESNYGSVSISN
ncbi:MAG: hypothetical protein DRI89_03150 [Bacteroidetes bacterium]|nr:MAG: hypothetical protein DRI89_03150 [Bacteroidota bacterium]